MNLCKSGCAAIVAILCAISAKAAAQPAPPACTEAVLPQAQIASANSSASLPQPATAIAWQRLALDREDAGDLSGSLGADDCALALDDSDGRTYYHRAQLQTALKNYQAALEDYERAIDQEFNQPFVYFEQALALRATGQVQEAMEILGKISEQKADDSLKSQALENLSILRLQYPYLKPNVPNLQPVARDFDAAVQLARKSPDPYNNRGVFRLLQMDYAGARRDFNKSQTLKGKNNLGEQLLDFLLDSVAYDFEVSEATATFQDRLDGTRFLVALPVLTSPDHHLITYKYMPVSKAALPNRPYLFIYTNEPSRTIDWQPYMQQVRARVKNNWKPGQASAVIKTVVRFYVAASGAADSLKVITSSGDLQIDQAAMEAVRASAPFNLLPVQYTVDEGEKRRIEVSFTFDVNVKKK